MTKNNPFAKHTFAQLTHVAGAMLRKEYDFTGKDINTHPLDLTEALMEYADHYGRARDICTRDTIWRLVGRLQEMRYANS